MTDSYESPASNRSWLGKAWDFAVGNNRLIERGIATRTKVGQVIPMAIAGAGATRVFFIAAHCSPVKGMLLGAAIGTGLCILATQVGTFIRARKHDREHAPSP